MKRHPEGFTLIELLIAITTLTLVLSISGASYSKFNRKMTLKQASLTLKTNLRSVQFHAINGSKPINIACTQLDGYSVSFTSSSYSYQASCTPVASDAPATTVTLPKGVTFSPIPSAILYKVLGAGIDRSSQLQLILVNSLASYILAINPNGEIIDLGEQ
ncbi:MAG: prepilin-type N-terminal cleavage/methylation domain-containing protein [Patescibacteria group bacterium]